MKKKRIIYLFAAIITIGILSWGIPLLTPYGTKDASYGKWLNRILPDSALHIPEKDSTTYNDVNTTCQLILDKKDTSVRYNYGSTWYSLKGGNTVNIDSIRNAINLRLLIADTSFMLVPYARVSDINGIVASYGYLVAPVANFQLQHSSIFFSSTNMIISGSGIGALGGTVVINGDTATKLASFYALYDSMLTVRGLIASHSGSDTTLRGKAIPALSVGALSYNGTSWYFNNTSFLTYSQWGADSTNIYDSLAVINTRIGAAGITSLTGDGTASGSGSVVFTLASVNANIGSWGSASSVATFTVNAKGLIIAAGSTSILISESQVTSLTSDLLLKRNIADTTGNGSFTTTRYQRYLDSIFNVATYLKNITGITAGGDLTGTYPNPTVNTINSITKSYYDPTSSIQTQLNGKQSLLGFTAENVANKTVTASSSTTTYPNWSGLEIYGSATFQPLENQRLSTTNNVGFNTLNLATLSGTPSTPGAGILLYADSVNRLSWIKSDGHVRSMQFQYAGNQVVKFENKAIYTAADSADVVSAGLVAVNIAGYYVNGFKVQNRLNTDSIFEGSTNLFYTSTRVQSVINSDTVSLLATKYFALNQAFIKQNGTNQLTGNWVAGAFSIQNIYGSATANTMIIGNSLSDTTHATNNNQMWSPFNVYEARGWNTSTSKSDTLKVYTGITPIQSVAGTPYIDFNIYESYNAAASTNIWTLTNTGVNNSFILSHTNNGGMGYGVNDSIYMGFKWDFGSNGCRLGTFGLSSATTIWASNALVMTLPGTPTGQGNVEIGGATIIPSAILSTQTTTKGVLFSPMTATQMNAIASPATGLLVYNTTLNKYCFYNSAAWQQIGDIHSSVSTTGTATTTFTVTIGQTMPNNTYQAIVQPTDALALGGYVTNKTTTTFDYVVPAATGSVTFDWNIPQ